MPWKYTYHKGIKPFSRSRGANVHINRETGEKSFLYKGHLVPLKSLSSGVAPVSLAAMHLLDIAKRKIRVQKLKFEVDFAKYMLSQFMTAFDQKRFYDDRGHLSRWPKLSSTTVIHRKNPSKYKTHNRNANDILVDWGVLKKSIVDGNSLLRYSVGHGNVIITNPSAYAKAKVHPGFVYAGVHNQGIRNGFGKGIVIPKRQFIGHTKNEKSVGFAKIEKIMFDELFTPIL